jgi:hypothetical protein
MGVVLLQLELTHSFFIVETNQILDTCLRYGSKDNMTAIVVQLPGCEKSYADASKSVTKASSSDETAEGVAGRRRKREEAMSAPQMQQQQGGSGENHNYAGGAASYGVSAPE